MGVTRFNGTLEYGSEVLIAGIDPEAEAELVGIDKAVVENENSQYLTTEDNVIQYFQENKIENKLIK